MTTSLTQNILITSFPKSPILAVASLIRQSSPDGAEFTADLQTHDLDLDLSVM